ncbi:hypothetical protein [Noviherbaspirillum pedocola]|uniref:Uncharacterized protein n=1 Tax=Noviherbaspirillum pedocola TaxID=2801341 RepID=A0A934W178_9BURK|nr:hypothetical protein [Noviherbaspirillum pedocola]MBK4734891.1 hypothetical protein [Noviherbaspirillum pedocola]
MRIDQHGVTAPVHQQHTQATDEGQQVQTGNGPQQAPVVHRQAQYAALLVNLGNARVAPANFNGPGPALAARNGPARGVTMLLDAAAHLALNQ